MTRTSYALRRWLPTLSDAQGLAGEHRAAIGNWQEKVHRSTARGSVKEAMTTSMADRYAGDKAPGAGVTKSQVIASAYDTMRSGLSQWNVPLTGEGLLRADCVTWAKYRERRQTYGEPVDMLPLVPPDSLLQCPSTRSWQTLRRWS
jgi:hypothetical protein